MRLRLLFVYLVLSLSTSAFAAVNVQELQAMIPRFRQVSASIYAGGNPSNKSKGAGLNALAISGIYTMLNLQGGDIDASFYGWVNSYRQPGEFPAALENERLIWELYDLQWLNVPLNSHVPVSAESDVMIRAALEVMAAATPEQPLYVHCEHGADRTGLLIAPHRVLYAGWTPAEAHAEWVLNGHGRVSRLITGHLDVYFYKLIAELAPQTKRVPSLAEEDCAQHAI